MFNGAVFRTFLSLESLEFLRDFIITMKLLEIRYDAYGWNAIWILLGNNWDDFCPFLVFKCRIDLIKWHDLSVHLHFQNTSYSLLQRLRIYSD